MKNKSQYTYISIILILFICNISNISNNNDINNYNNNDKNENSNIIRYLQTDSSEEEIDVKKLSSPIFDCNSNDDCGGNGTCINNKCFCKSGYITYKAVSTGCNYSQSTQTKAFLFELFLGFGIGHFYCGRTTTAALKMVAFLFGICIICLFPLSGKIISEKCNSDGLIFTVSCFFYLYALGLAIWFVYDLTLFGMNKYKDGNGIELLPWGRD